MAIRKKGFQAKQSRRMARRMDDSMVGSHVERTPSHSRRAPNADSVSFSGSRSRSAGGHVGAVAPRTSSGESDAAYRHRRGQRGYVEGIRHRSRMRRLLTVVVAAIAVVAVALIAGFFAFRGAVGSEMALKNSDAPDALVTVKSDEPYYVLVAAELGAVAEPLEQAGPDAMLLAYVDRPSSKLSFVVIPGNLQVAVDNTQKRLGDVALSGDAALIRAVQNFAKVNITHFVKIDKGGVEGIVDTLDGVDVTLGQIVDDPHAGDIYLPAGEFTLNGTAALTYLRANNLALGVTDQLKNQADFAARVLCKLFAGDGAFAAKLESIDSYFQTDMSLADLEVIAGWLAGAGVDDIAHVALPGYMNTTAGVVEQGESRFVCTSSEIAEVIASFEGRESEGSESSETPEAPASVSPSSFTVEVQNGTDIAGAAAATAEQLTAAGFRVEKSGNAEQQVYTETLVVYKTSDDDGKAKAEDVAYQEDSYQYDENGELIEEALVPEPAAASAGGNGNGVGQARAQTVIASLGMGRAVEAGDYYTFDTDILVIIGSDYKPIS